MLLAGPRVSRLLPFLTARGYVCDGATKGGQALELLRASPRHVLLVELELGDMLLADLLQVVHAENLAGAVILLEDPAKSGLIVSTLLRGVDGYVATPPDENHLFRLIERQLLAQWAFAQTGNETELLQAENARLEKVLLLERGKVTELVKEIASLREEVAESRAAAQARAQTAANHIPGFDDDSPAIPVAPAAPIASRPSVAMAPSSPPQPSALSGGIAATIRGGVPKQPSLSDLDDLDFDSTTTGVTKQTPGTPAGGPAATFDDAELDVVRRSMEDLGLDDDEFDDPTSFNPLIAHGPGAGAVEMKEATTLKTKEVARPPSLTSSPNTVKQPQPKPAQPTGLPRPASHVNDERTSPIGWQAPALAKDIGSDDVAATAATEEVAKQATNWGPTRKPPPPAKKEAALDIEDDSGSDLFFDLDEGDTIAGERPEIDPDVFDD
jgi:DNA-binding response OmpR family regulator